MDLKSARDLEDRGNESGPSGDVTSQRSQTCSGGTSAHDADSFAHPHGAFLDEVLQNAAGGV